MNISASMRFAAVGLFSAFLSAAQSPGPGMTASTAARILEQATWGPTPASVQALQTAGFDSWFASQVSAPVTTYANLPMLASDGTAFSNMAGTQVQFFENALYNPDQLRQRVAFALSEIWVVSKTSTIGYAAAFPPLLNIFQQDAFGSYAQLINDVTLNPAMGQYLDMVNNHKTTGTFLPNENYGREVMQLFTIGLNVLNPDGTLPTTPAPTYLQPTVDAISKVFTGWTYAATPTGGTSPNYFSPMVPVPTQHDTTAKQLLFNTASGAVQTVNLPASNTPALDLADAIAALMQNPNMAPFISQQLIQHLVTSNPSPAYVGRVSAVFTSSGGNLQAVVKAILTDPEARAGDASVAGDLTQFGHLREPVLLLTNLLRGMNGVVYDSSTIYNYSSALGQNLFYAPSVFSYFSPDYHVGQLAAPEFQLHNTQTSVTRANYIYSIIYSGKLDASTLFDISAFVTAAGTSTAALTTAISNQFFHGMMSPTLQTAITNGIVGQTTATTKAQAALYVALTSSEFQIMH